jgi:hypothetical protein
MSISNGSRDADDDASRDTATDPALDVAPRGRRAQAALALETATSEIIS